MAGWNAVLTGQTAEAERWAAFLETASFDLVPADGSASFESSRAMLRAAMCPGGPEQMAGRCELRGRRGAALEPVWCDRADLVGRGAAAPRRQ